MEERLKDVYGRIYELREDGKYYQNGFSFFPYDECELFPLEMKLGGINKILRRTRAYFVGVRFRAMQKRDRLSIEQFMVYD